MSLDPLRLTPAASINRVVLVDLPGIALPDEVRGKRAYDLLSTRAVSQYVLDHGADLGLPPNGVAAGDLPRFLDHCFQSPDAAVRQAAEQAAGEFGLRLAWVLATLKHGYLASRVTRPDWDDSYWDHWASIQRVWMGGGLMSGDLGRAVARRAVERLADWGVSDLDVQAAPHAQLLPLIGCARCAPSESTAALVFDFGQSYVKRACAIYEGGMLAALRLLPFVSLDVHTAKPSQDPGDQARALAGEMAACIAGAWGLVYGRGLLPAPLVQCSVAAYMVDGHPADYQGGGYISLRLVADNAADWLAADVSDRVRQPVAVGLIHDGTAAARALAGQVRSAVIMMGTALGVGFPPGDGGLRPISPSFVVDTF